MPQLAVEREMKMVGDVDGAERAAVLAEVANQRRQRVDVLGVRRRSADQDDDLLRLLAPGELMNGGVDALENGFLPVASALGLDVGDEGAQLLGLEAEVGPFGDVLVAL